MIVFARFVGVSVHHRRAESGERFGHQATVVRLLGRCDGFACDFFRILPVAQAPLVLGDHVEERRLLRSIAEHSRLVQQIPARGDRLVGRLSLQARAFARASGEARECRDRRSGRQARPAHDRTTLRSAHSVLPSRRLRRAGAAPARARRVRSPRARQSRRSGAPRRARTPRAPRRRPPSHAGTPSAGSRRGRSESRSRRRCRGRAAPSPSATRSWMRARRRGLIVRRTASTSRPCVNVNSLPDISRVGSMTACAMPSSSASSTSSSGAGARGHREIDVERRGRSRPPYSRMRRVFADSRSRRRSMRPVSAAGKLALTLRAQRPASMLVPHGAVVEQHAHELRREQRIAFRVPLQEREQVAARVAAEARRQPLLNSRRDRRESAISWKRSSRSRRWRRSSASPRVSSERIVRQMSIRSCSSCAHDVLEHVPRRRVRPLHVVEHDDDRPRRRREAQVRDDLVEQTCTCCRSARARLEPSAGTRRGSSAIPACGTTPS